MLTTVIRSPCHQLLVVTIERNHREDHREKSDAASPKLKLVNQPFKALHRFSSIDNKLYWGNDSKHHCFCLEIVFIHYFFKGNIFWNRGGGGQVRKVSAGPQGRPTPRTCGFLHRSISLRSVSWIQTISRVQWIFRIWFLNFNKAS